MHVRRVLLACSSLGSPGQEDSRYSDAVESSSQRQVIALSCAHRGRSDRAANANANSDAPRTFGRLTFHTPPVLKGAAIFDNSAPAVYKIQGP